MKKIAYLFDSSSGHQRDEKDKDIYVVPCNIIYKKDGKDYKLKENEEISQDQINQLLSEGVQVKTAFCTPQVIKNKIEELLKEYDTIYYTPISNGLSSNYDDMKMWVDELNKKEGKRRVVMVRSNAACYLADIVMDRLKTLYKVTDKGDNFDKVQQRIDDEIDHRMYVGMLFVNNLDALIRGGRIKKFPGTLAKIFNLKLVILMDKTLNFLNKALTYDKQIDIMVNFFNDLTKQNHAPIDRVCFLEDGLASTHDLYFNKLHLERRLRDELNLAPDCKFIWSVFPGVIKAHTGLNAQAVIIRLKTNDEI